MPWPRRRPEREKQERVVLSIEHAALTATATRRVFPPSRKFRVDRVRYLNPTGLALNGANYFTLTLQKGATVMATFSTQATNLAAAAWTELVLSATEANRVIDPTDLSLNFVATLTGTATLPADGRLVVEGTYVE